MQHTSNELYSDTSIENNIPLHKVKFVGDIIFNEINNSLKEPKAIILKIKNIGKFYMRKNKLDSEIDYLLKNNEDNVHSYKINILLERQKEYEKYLEEKQKIKKIRHEHQIIMENNIQEEDL